MRSLKGFRRDYSFIWACIFRLICNITGLTYLKYVQIYTQVIDSCIPLYFELSVLAVCVQTYC